MLEAARLAVKRNIDERGRDDLVSSHSAGMQKEGKKREKWVHASQKGKKKE